MLSIFLSQLWGNCRYAKIKAIYVIAAFREEILATAFIILGKAHALYPTYTGRIPDVYPTCLTCQLFIKNSWHVRLKTGGLPPLSGL
jgi:hypothetical protein